MQVRMKLQRQGSFDVVLGLKVHLFHAYEHLNPKKGKLNAYIDQLVHILDVDFVTSYSPYKVHEPELFNGVNVSMHPK